MSADFIVSAVVVVCLLCWIESNVHAIAKRGEPANDPEDRPVTWRKYWILSKRSDHSARPTGSTPNTSCRIASTVLEDR
jgi:hypothetical protein